MRRWATVRLIECISDRASGPPPPRASLHWEINAHLLRGKAFSLFSGLLPFSLYCPLLGLFEIVSRTFRNPFPYKGDSVVSGPPSYIPIAPVHPHPSSPGWALTTPGF